MKGRRWFPADIGEEESASPVASVASGDWRENGGGGGRGGRWKTVGNGRAVEGGWWETVGSGGKRHYEERSGEEPYGQWYLKQLARVGAMDDQ